MPLPNSRLSPLFLAGLLILSTTSLPAKNKKVKTPPQDPQDAIEVVGHVPLTGGSVTRFLTTQHHSSHYLYAEHAGGTGVTLIDVTRVEQPSVLANVAYSPDSGSKSLFAVVGTAALVTDQPAPVPIAAAVQTIRIMDLSDPQHPKVAREFTGVTALNRDDRRGLIFLANQDGIWILHQSLAQDPEVEKAYANHVLYDH